MRCLLVVAVLVAAVGAASVSQRVSVSGSSRGGESVSVSETSSSIRSDTGTTLGTRSSFSSRRRTPAAVGTPAQAGAPVAPATAQRAVPAAAPAAAASPAVGATSPAVGAASPAVGAASPVAGAVPSTAGAVPAAGGTSLQAAQSALSGSIPVVPSVRPLRPLNIQVPSLGAPAIGTRFNSRPGSGAGVAPALAGAQASLNQAAAELSAVMSALGV
ncbi:cuticle protein 16.5-like [Amphibalanus amphitrite]|uniref:cuticle protein 16.5-like n=1 Tax=Amphibalanus amphitrite TaxID=1232801 RepID=UPI001C91FBB5|nr:cuticle protein 16.5-like [Amphibalanus amphitrite]